MGSPVVPLYPLPWEVPVKNWGSACLSRSRLATCCCSMWVCLKELIEQLAYLNVVNRHDLVVEDVLHHDRLNLRHAHPHSLGFTVGALLIVHWGSHIQAIILNLNFKLSELHSLTHYSCDNTSVTASAMLWLFMIVFLMSRLANYSKPRPVMKTDTRGMFAAWALSSNLMAASVFSNGTTKYFGESLLRCSSN